VLNYVYGVLNYMYGVLNYVYGVLNYMYGVLNYVYGVLSLKIICFRVASTLCMCSCTFNKIFVTHCIADVNSPKKRDAATCILPLRKIEPGEKLGVSLK